MKVTPLSSTLPGEHIVDVSPVMQPATEDAGWHERLNFWTGRALTEQALETEQDNRAARLAWTGRLVAPGIVNGLDVAIEPRAASLHPLKNDTLNGQFVHLMPGYGLMATGEDVVIPQPMRVDLGKIPVIYGQAGVTSRALPSTPWFTDSTTGNIVLRWHLLNPRYVPWAAVLLLRPATLLSVANCDPLSPCQLDPSYDAFDDPRLVDASRLLLFMVPPSLRRNPTLNGYRGDVTWRNRVASMILQMDIERVTRQQILYRDALPAGMRWKTALVGDDLLPWEYFGVPIGLIGFESWPGATARRRLFLDRGCVARPGGRARPRPRPAIVPSLDLSNASPAGSGTPAIWHSRVAQFGEQLNDLLTDDEFKLPPDATVAQVQAKWQELQQRFFYLPPAGLLPPAALHFLTTDEAAAQGGDRAANSWFFPPGYSARAVPIVNEEVEAMLAASAPLAGYDPANLDPTKPEPVCILVPMPESTFDPNLLVVEQPDQAFKNEVKRLFALRQDWRQRRDYVRGRRDDLSAIVQGNQSYRASALSVNDPDQLEAEPTQTEAGFPFPCEIIPVDGKPSPWKIDIVFTPANTFALSSLSKLSALLHLDEEQPPAEVDLQWHLNDGATIDSRFDVNSMPAVDVGDAVTTPGSPPAAVDPHRNFERTVADTGLGNYAANFKITGVSVVLTGGRAALARVSVTDTNNVAHILWTPSQYSNTQQNAHYDGWQTIAGPLLLAPFEDLYKPAPEDGRDFQTLLSSLLDPALLLELTPALLAMDSNLKVAVRRNYLQLGEVGLQRVIQVMTNEADKAAGVVDLSYGKIQANMQLMQSVISGDTDTDQVATSPAASAMSAVSGLNVAKTQMTQSMAVNPNWTTPADIRPVKNNVIKSFSLDDSAELQQPRLLNFTRRFAYGPAYQAYQTVTTGMITVLKSIANLKIGYTAGDVVPEVTHANGGQVLFLELANVTDFSQFSFPYPVQVQFDATNKPIITSGDTSGDIVAKGIHRADVVSLILRKVETFIARRRQLIDNASAALAAARAQVNAANTRMITLNGKLGEARHDMSVARALWQEELDRVATVNTRRDDLIATQVQQLVFVRPRCVCIVSYDLPSCELDGADALAPIPACLQSDIAPPDELEAYLQLFRQAPARWFLTLSPRLREIDTRDRMVRLLNAVRQNAGRMSPSAVADDATSAGARVYAAGYARIEQLRSRATEQLIVTNANTWEDNYRLALDHASLGDLMDGAHGCNEISRAAAQELEDFGKVAACLYAEFNAVQPGIRMAWVERYSQFDQPAPLRDIAGLPQAGSLPLQTRKRFQAYLDWIFGQIDQNDEDAVSLVNDLARVCLLLASHAPVNRLILGHAARPMPIAVGLLIPIQPAQPSLVRVGMQFQVWRDSTCVARGTVENLRDADVSVRVEETHPDYKTIDASMNVQFMPSVKRLQ